jgi:hypothetical protein
MSGWHWYDTLIFVAVWSLPGLVFGMKAYMDWRWQKRFGERKPQ